MVILMFIKVVIVNFALFILSKFDVQRIATNVQTMNNMCTKFLVYMKKTSLHGRILETINLT